MLFSLHRALTTKNPGGEPDNSEAVRQLVYFANSLHNRRLRQPPPVPRMKSWSCFTPHFQEPVACSMSGLHATTEDNASELTMLKSLHPDEWANLTERINLVDRTIHSNSNNNSSSSSSSSNNSTTPLGMHSHKEQQRKEIEQWASDRSQVLS